MHRLKKGQEAGYFGMIHFQLQLLSLIFVLKAVLSFSQDLFFSFTLYVNWEES